MNGDRRIAAAERAAAKLTELGHHKEAEDVCALVRTYRGSRRVNSQLHADNQALRGAAP